MEEDIKVSHDRMDANGKVMLARIEIIRTRTDADLAKARLETIHDKSDINQMRLEAKMHLHQEGMNALIAGTKDGRKDRTTCQEATEANPEKVEPTPEENEAVVEQQEISNKEAAINSLKVCRTETMACQEITEARLECEKPTSVDMESEVEHREVPKEHASLETSKAPSKRHSERHLAKKRRDQPKKRTQDNNGS
jgi:hypothetical protein